MINRARIAVVSVLLNLLDTAAHRVILAIWAMTLNRTVHALTKELVQSVSLPSRRCIRFQVCRHRLQNLCLSLDWWKMWCSLHAPFWPLEKVRKGLVFVNSSISIIQRLDLSQHIGVSCFEILAFGGWCCIHECSFAIIENWTIVLVFIFINFI